LAARNAALVRSLISSRSFSGPRCFHCGRVDIAFERADLG